MLCLGFTHGTFADFAPVENVDQARLSRIAAAKEYKKGEDVIIQYDTGVYIEITETFTAHEKVEFQSSEVAEQEFLRNLVAERINDSTKFGLSDGVLGSKSPLGNFGEDAASSEKSTLREFSQKIGKVEYPALEVAYRDDSKNGTLKVSGILVDLTLPQLDPKLWLDESAAMELAIASLSQYAVGERGRWFAEAVKGGQLKGRLFIDVYRTSSALSVEPIFRVEGHDSVAYVNLYTGVVNTQSRSPKSVSNEVKTNVCRPGLSMWHDSCASNPNLPNNPQVYTVFGEDSSGNRVCTDGFPFYLPTTAQCLLFSYQMAHEVIKQSEDLLDDQFSDLCCSNLGETVTAYGTTFKQLDVHMHSPYPELSGDNAYFWVGGSPWRATIFVNYNLANYGAAGGWQNLIGHEWAHAYARYYGSFQSGGLGNGGADDGMIVLRSIEEGLANAFSVIVDKIVVAKYFCPQF
jgi:hypothetical protein